MRQDMRRDVLTPYGLSPVGLHKRQAISTRSGLSRKRVPGRLSGVTAHYKTFSCWLSVLVFWMTSCLLLIS